MNFCAIAYTFYESDYRVRRYAEALATMGHRVDVISLRRSGQKRHGFLNGVNIDRIQRREFNEKGLHGFILRNLLFFLKACAIILIKYLKYRYKVIHVHNAPDFLVFTGLIPKLLGAKIILDMHENLPEFYCAKFRKGLDTYSAKLLLFVERLSTGFADSVIAAHDLLRERIIKRDRISPRRCTALLNYPEASFFEVPSNGSSIKGLRIVYPGTISYHHGVDIAIKALAIVKKELPDVRFDIYARSRNMGYYNYLLTLIEGLDLRDNVRILEPVKTEELGTILANANLGIVPKRDGVFASEAFSSKIFDFMAAGVPIIASRTKIDEYYFDDSMVMFFQPENHTDLARCILELFQNPEKRETLARKGKRIIERNNWEVKSPKYLDIVHSLVGSTKK